MIWKPWLEVHENVLMVQVAAYEGKVFVAGGLEGTEGKKGAGEGDGEE